MPRKKKQHVRFQVLLGLLLTLLVVTAEYFGYLDPLEKRLYDWRALHCQFFAKPPTDRLVHFDITDRDIETVGGLPWPRSVYAEILDEVRTAGARAVAFDVTFSET